MRPTFLLVAASLLVFSILTLVYITQQGNEPVLTWVGDLSFVLLSFFVFIGCWFVYQKVASEYGNEKCRWLCSSIAFLFFMLGDLYWGYAEIFLKVEVPLGSLADWSWEIAYLLLFISLGCILKERFADRTQFWTITIVTALAAGSYFFWQIMHHIQLGEWVTVIQHSYVFYDIILLGVSTYLITPLITSHNRLVNTCLFFGLAIFARIIFDFLFAGMTAINTYSTGSMIDLIYGLSYVLFMFSADSKFKILGGKTVIE